MLERLKEYDASVRETPHLRGLIEQSQGEQARLVCAIDAFSQLLPAKDRREVLRRLANTEGAYKATTGKNRPHLDSSKRMRAVKRWLIRSEVEHFQVCELTTHLRRQGYCLPPTYAANACRELVRQGVLYRLGRG